MKFLVQQKVDLGEPIGGEGLGPFGTIGQSISPGSGSEALERVTGAISAIIGFMTVCAAIWFLFQFVIGGISWISAGGDKTKLQQARDRITNACIGLIIVVAGWAILALAGQFFGWSEILLPSTIIDKMRFGN